MSKKMQLPDELLDAVSGGILTYGGDVVLDFNIGDDSMSVTTSAGTFVRQYTAQDKAELQEEGGAGKLTGMLKTLDQHEGVYALESFGLPEMTKV